MVFIFAAANFKVMLACLLQIPLFEHGLYFRSCNIQPRLQGQVERISLQQFSTSLASANRTNLACKGRLTVLSKHPVRIAIILLERLDVEGPRHGVSTCSGSRMY